MVPWTPAPPASERIGDHDVRCVGRHLRGRRIALVVSAGIAAMKAPLLARALRRYGAEVVAYLSEEAARYVAPDALEWATNSGVVRELTARSEHLSNSQPFDAYLVAPATYNTINKLRHGIADSLTSTTLAAALGMVEQGRTALLIAPTMHGDLHTSVLQESLAELASKGVVLIPPRDDYGKHNLPDSEVICAYVASTLSRSVLKGVRVLITSGATPTYIDNVRAITNRFRGRLGIEIAKELTLRGADVQLILGAGAVSSPAYVPTCVVRDFAEYRKVVLKRTGQFEPDIGIFSAAVADYEPKRRLPGKTPSDGSLREVQLVPTVKVIDLVRESFPRLAMVTFKYQEDISLEQLFDIGHKRLAQGHSCVILNRGEDATRPDGQVAYLLSEGRPPLKLSSKTGIAIGLCDHLEVACSR